jgi:hypothetical protein
MPLSQRIRGMVRKAKGINTLGYSFSDIFFFSATSVTATIGMVMVVTPHTLTSPIKLQEKECCCTCNCCNDEKHKEYLAKLSSASEAASLLEILRNGIVLLLSSLLKLSNPLNIFLIDVIALTDSLGLVCKTVTKVSVLNESGKNLVTIGSKSSVVESVDVLSNTVGCYAELLTAKLIKLKEGTQEFLI